MRVLVGSLFSGARLMDIGLEQAGMKVVWTVEILDGQDIRTEQSDRYARVGLIAGGPPCQKTSRAATFSGRKTNESLWPEMLRFVRNLTPAWVLVEQPEVAKEWVFSVAQDLEQLGYGVAGRIIDSKHWVPQQRNRWYIVGRLGVTGLELWDYLYSGSERVEGVRESQPSHKFLGNCPDCLRGGVFARNAARKSALVGAGNGVTVPVVTYLGRAILNAERQIRAEHAE